MEKKKLLVVIQHLRRGGVELAAIGRGLACGFTGMVAVDGIKLEAPLAAERHGFVEQVALAHTPQDEQVAFGLQLFECGDGKGDFFTDVRIFVLDDSPVEIYGNGHN